MTRLIGAVVICAVALRATTVLAACPGDCGGNGEVTVDELVLGVNIALGTASVSQCTAMDSSGEGEVTINELIAAVNSALNGCMTGNLAGDYSGAVTFDSTHAGSINLTADANGQVSGALLVTETPRIRRSLSFAFPVGGVSVALTGPYDLVSGGFEASGSFVDANGQTTSVVVSGNLPGPTGSAPINVYVGSDPPFSATLSAGMLATPTPTPGPTPPPGNGPRIAFASGAPSQIFVINVDGSGKTQLTHSSGNSTNPAWSPDGAKIAFQRRTKQTTTLVSPS